MGAGLLRGWCDGEWVSGLLGYGFRLSFWGERWKGEVAVGEGGERCG